MGKHSAVFDRIDYLVAKAGITGTELTRKIGLSSTGIYSQWRSGYSGPSNKTIKKIAEYFDVPFENIKYGEPVRGRVYSESRPDGAQKENAPGQEAEGIQLTELELDTILRYRSAPVEIQKAVDRVLEVDEPPE